MGHLRSIDMENPYASPAALSAERPRRRGFWRAMLLAYAIHHGAMMAGFLLGLVFTPSVWKQVDTPEKFWILAMTVVTVPMLDLYVLIEPALVGESVPPTFLALRWSRSVLVLTIPIALLSYGVWRHRAALWYVGLLSFLIAMSLAITMAFDSSVR